MCLVNARRTCNNGKLLLVQKIIVFKSEFEMCPFETCLGASGAVGSAAIRRVRRIARKHRALHCILIMGCDILFVCLSFAQTTVSTCFFKQNRNCFNKVAAYPEVRLTANLSACRSRNKTSTQRL